MIRQVLRWAVRVGAVAAALGAAYVAVTLVQVWISSRHDSTKAAQAIVVLGAAQYNGRPSPDLKARLDHTLILWNRHVSSLIVVTGGKAPGDRFTEASASATYLEEHGVPDASILREVQGRSSWESLGATAQLLHERGVHDVVLVSDPFHSKRLEEMTGELGLVGRVSPTATSPIRGASVLPYFAKETVAVAIGRIIGFRRLLGLERRTSFLGIAW